MLERGVAAEGQSHKMMKNEDNRRWCWASRRHCVFFILVLGVVFFFQYTSIKEMAPSWNPKQWIQNNSTKLLVPFRKQNIASKDTNGPEVEPTAAGATAGFTATHTSDATAGVTATLTSDATAGVTATLTSDATAGVTATLTSDALPQTERISSTLEPTTEHQTTVTLEVTQREVHQLTAQPTPVPRLYFVKYPYEYHFLINEPQRCEQEKPFVVLMVPVAPRNRAHRDIIRSTWGNEDLVLDKVVKLFFLLGIHIGHDAQQVHEQLLQESKEHRDLIQSDFMDCYNNLTIKTMVMLEWLNSYCSGASYVMKIDTDMFLNVPNLVKMLLNAPKTNYMTGLVAHDGEVLRDPSSKWYLPHEVFSPAIYPPYALGMGYILSLDLTVKLIEASRHVKAVYIEDAYLGMCLKHLGITHTNPPEGATFHNSPIKYDRCDFSKIIATTVEPYIDRIWQWKDFKREGPYC